jgi:hypothetical protein
MGSGTVIYVVSYRDWFRSSKVNRGGYTDIHTEQRNLTSILYFLKIRKVG